MTLFETKQIEFPIPKDAWHEPLINKYGCKNNACWLWQSEYLKSWLSLKYPECYEFIKKSNGQSQEEYKA